MSTIPTVIASPSCRSSSFPLRKAAEPAPYWPALGPCLCSFVPQCKSTHVCHIEMRAANMRHSVQGTDCHFQHLACALNQSCLQLEPRFSFPLSASAICYCLRYLGRRAGLVVAELYTQIPLGSRMNLSSKHPVRLSLRRLLLPPFLVTRFIRIAPRSASSHISNTPSGSLAATIRGDKASLLRSSSTQLGPHLPHPRGSCLRKHLLRTCASLALKVSEYRQAGLHRRTELSGKSLRLSIQPPYQKGLLHSPWYFCAVAWTPNTRSTSAY